MPKFIAVKPVIFYPPPTPTPGGGLAFGRPITVNPGDVITLGQLVPGYGSDALPMREATIADGTRGRVGMGVTVENGHLRCADEQQQSATAPVMQRLVGKTIAAVAEQDVYVRDMNGDDDTLTILTLTFTDGSGERIEVSHLDYFEDSMRDATDADGA